MHDLLIQAINDRLTLVLDYEPGDRTIEPCAYGQSSEGHPLLRAFQTAGASASGEHENWKLFRVDRIKQIALTGESFSGPRPAYKRGDKAMKRQIYAQL